MDKATIVGLIIFATIITLVSCGFACWRYHLYGGYRRIADTNSDMRGVIVSV